MGFRVRVGFTVRVGFRVRVLQKTQDTNLGTLSYKISCGKKNVTDPRTNQTTYEPTDEQINKKSLVKIVRISAENKRGRVS